MAEFVKHHKDGQAQKKLGGFDQGNHGANVHLAPAPVRNSRTSAHNEFKVMHSDGDNVASSKHEAHSLEVAVVVGGLRSVDRFGGLGGVGLAR